MDEKEIAIKYLHDLAEQLASHLVYRRELKEAVTLRHRMQKENSELIDELLDFERLLKFVPKNLERAFLSAIRIYYAIENREKVSSHLLKDYDEKSERYIFIRKRVKELEGFIEEYDKKSFLAPLAPTLMELVNNYTLTLDSVNNYMNNTRDFWNMI
jgi:hypothetical protein